jgi:hypothetical protein
MKIAVAIAVILLSFGTFDEARADFLPGDFITFSQTSWELTLPGGPTLVAHYNTVYASTLGELEVGIPGAAGHSIIFTGASALLAYLPSTGPAAPLNTDHVDPLSSASGVYGGEVAALHLNIDFSDAGHTLGALGIPFGDLVIHNYAAIPQVHGLTVRQVLAQADTLLGGGTVGYSVSAADILVNELNSSFASGQIISQFAQNHLRIVTQAVPEPTTLGLLVIGVVALAVRRFTRGTRGSSSWRARGLVEEHELAAATRRRGATVVEECCDGSGGDAALLHAGAAWSVKMLGMRFSS